MSAKFVINISIKNEVSIKLAHWNPLCVAFWSNHYDVYFGPTPLWIQTKLLVGHQLPLEALI